MELIERHGDPYYIKIDIEHFDAEILQCLFVNNIRPPYLSAEYHNPEVLTLLLESGRYDAFKLIHGFSVARKFRNVPVQSTDGETTSIRFPPHAAGPFGEDIVGHWLCGKLFTRMLNIVGCGWKDIHATTEHGGRTQAFSKREQLNLYLQGAYQRTMEFLGKLNQ